MAALLIIVRSFDAIVMLYNLIEYSNKSKTNEVALHQAKVHIWQPISTSLTSRQSVSRVNTIASSEK